MPIYYAQLFCSVADIYGDQDAPAGDVARWVRAIREASAIIADEIGNFIPVTDSKVVAGNGGAKIFIPYMTAITAVTNYDDALTEGEDFIAYAWDRWNGGPYISLERLPLATTLSCWYDEIDGVTLEGRFGKFEKAVSTATTVQDATQQDASQLTLKVGDGSAISPGMVLKLGDEQQLVTGYSTPSASVTLLAAAVAIADEQITVDDASLVNIGEIIRVGFEQMVVKDKNETTDKLSVMRGFNATQKTTHADNDPVDVYRTYTVERGVNGTTAAVHANALAISRYVPPDDILGLCRQMAVLNVNKARSGYAGKAGNEQTGVTYYNDDLPRFFFQQIKEKYAIL